MTNGGKALLCALSLLVFWTGSRAMATETSGGNPYQAIVDRNVFGLKPPAPPPDPEANKPPPPKITLTGIYTMGGNKRVLMKVQVPARPPEPAKEVPLTLAEGQRDGDVEVLEIDTVARTVKVNNSGTVTSLDFTNNGVKIASAAPPGGMPNPAGARPAAVPNPFAPGGVGKPPPTAREMRLGPTGAAVSPAAYGGVPAAPSYSGTRLPTAYGTASAAPAYSTTPGMVVGGTPSGTLTLPGTASAATTTTRQQNWPPETPMTPEQRVIAEAAYLQKYAKEIQAGTMPSIPGGNPLIQGGGSSGQTTPPANTTPQLPLPPGAAQTFPQ